MSFTEAFRALNGFKRRKTIRDYRVIGAVAATTYMEPVFTELIDVIVLVDTDAEYRSAFVAVAQEAQEGMHQVQGGVPVQLFPSTIIPLFRYSAMHCMALTRYGLATLVSKSQRLST